MLHIKSCFRTNMPTTTFAHKKATACQTSRYFFHWLPFIQAQCLSLLLQEGDHVRYAPYHQESETFYDSKHPNVCFNQGTLQLIRSRISGPSSLVYPGGGTGLITRYSTFAYTIQLPHCDPLASISYSVPNPLIIHRKYSVLWPVNRDGVPASIPDLLTIP